MVNSTKLVFKHIPNGIECRLSTNSSNIDIFEKALKDCGYNVKLSYKNSIETSKTQKRKNRPRRILWFTPPYNMEVINILCGGFVTRKFLFNNLKNSLPNLLNY